MTANGHSPNFALFPVIIADAAARLLELDGTTYAVSFGPHLDYDGTLYPLRHFEAAAALTNGRPVFYGHYAYDKKPVLGVVEGATWSPSLKWLWGYIRPISEPAQAELMGHYKAGRGVSAFYMLSGHGQRKIGDRLFKVAHGIKEARAVDIVDYPLLGGRFMSQADARRADEAARIDAVSRRIIEQVTPKIMESVFGKRIIE